MPRRSRRSRRFRRSLFAFKAKASKRTMNRLGKKKLSSHRPLVFVLVLLSSPGEEGDGRRDEGDSSSPLRARPPLWAAHGQGRPGLWPPRPRGEWFAMVSCLVAPVASFIGALCKQRKKGGRTGPGREQENGRERAGKGPGRVPEEGGGAGNLQK